MANEEILIVDDSKLIVEMVKDALKPFGYQLSWAHSGEDALEKIQKKLPDLLLLDVMMSGIDGFEVCRHLRENQHTALLPIIMLTGRDEEIDKVLGLEMGADDYLTKPFGERELVARIKAVLRRVNREVEPPSTDVVEVADLKMDVNKHEASCNNQELTLTPLEFDLLLALMKHANMVLSRDKLLNQVWGYDYYGDVRVVDTHIKRLRKKLQKCAPDREYIVTVRGVGYKLVGE